jgi:hypothetical protein
MVKIREKIAHKAFDAAYERECLAIAQEVRKMAENIYEPSDMWKIHDYLSEKRNETDKKYDFRYSVLLFVFARLICDRWIRAEDLEGLSVEKLQEIHRIVGFHNRN